MLNVIPKNIKQIFVWTVYVLLLFFILGILMKNKYLYISFSLGVFMSLVSNAILLYVVYGITYKTYGLAMLITRYIITAILYMLVLYLSYYLVRDRLAILVSAMGLLSFRACTAVSIYLKKIHRK